MQNICGLNANNEQYVLFVKVVIIETAITGNYLFSSSKQMYKDTTTVSGGINKWWQWKGKKYAHAAQAI